MTQTKDSESPSMRNASRPKRDDSVSDAAAPKGNENATPTMSAPSPQRDHVGTASARGTLRWWVAVAAGLVVSAPFVWLLSYGAALPYYLGLFFFALFGLVIGAVMHRVASPTRPYGRGALLTGTTIVVLVGWCGTIGLEANGFPADMAEEASKMSRRKIPNVAAFRADVADGVRRFLVKKYPPGATLGYVRWVLISGKLNHRDVTGMSLNFEASQHGLTWAIRVVLSLALFAFGVGSQTLPLELVSERSHRVIDRTT